MMAAVFDFNFGTTANLLITVRGDRSASGADY
jgi:hypothetical protein